VLVGETAQEQLKAALKQEMNAVALFREAITHCAKVADYTTRHILEDMVKDEEEHVDWLETQLETIKQIGVENYLTEQIKKGES
jgi:bacterioferritin